MPVYSDLAASLDTWKPHSIAIAAITAVCLCMMLLSKKMLQLAAFMRERYFCTFYDAIKAMLPAGLWFQSTDTVSLTEDRSWEDKNFKKDSKIFYQPGGRQSHARI